MEKFRYRRIQDSRKRENEQGHSRYSSQETNFCLNAKKKPRCEQNLQGDTRSQSAPDFSARRRSRCVQESMWYLFGFWGQGGSGRSLPVTANAASLSPRYLRTIQFYRWVATRSVQLGAEWYGGSDKWFLRASPASSTTRSLKSRQAQASHPVRGWA